MAMGAPLFPGSSIRDELDRIFKLLGSPASPETTWPKQVIESKEYCDLIGQLPEYASGTDGLSELLGDRLGDRGVDLVRRMLVYSPDGRITAEEALIHPFFA